MPGDLNLKKSWNPALIKNQKKVWEQEQAALDEHLKLKSRDEELKRERERLDLIKLQYGDADKVPVNVKRELSNLDWMYKDPQAQTESEDGFREVDEEFLLGKKQVETMLSGKTQLGGKQESRFEHIVKGKTQDGSNDKHIASNDPLSKIRSEHMRKNKMGDTSKKRGERLKDIERVPGEKHKYSVYKNHPSKYHPTKEKHFLRLKFSHQGRQDRNDDVSAKKELEELDPMKNMKNKAINY